MTTAQRIKLMSHWWPAACRTQGWDASDRELRMRGLSLCVSRADWTALEFRATLEDDDAFAALMFNGRPLESANELNNTSDMDAVIRTLGMLSDNVAAGADTAEAGSRRRLINLLGPVLEELSVTRPDGEDVRKICRDKFNGVTNLTSLSNHQLQQLLMTLNRVARERKKTCAVETPF